jgi:hypothetical protein
MARIAKASTQMEVRRAPPKRVPRDSAGKSASNGHANGHASQVELQLILDALHR